MTDRELYAILKKNKMFSKFCLTCAQAFTEYINEPPRDSLKDYNERTAKKLMEKDENWFVGQIKSWDSSDSEIRMI